ncbi:ComEA family DNA-binding protein [Candidatus Rariloculus sp.]|uniref:ComEA family DNA-binding protein n=1 Tax=Candidatus Rariloculus sp. TaxID=3101265 RepID=UPI003D128CB1
MNSIRMILLSALLYVLGPATLMAGPVDINTADAQTLAAELNGIGPALAAAIVRDREANGRYGSPDALTRVSGIGPRVVEMNRENILTGETSETSTTGETGEESG